MTAAWWSAAFAGVTAPTGVLVLVGFIGAMAWMVADAAGGTEAKVANGVMLVLFGVCIVAGAVLTG